MQNMLESDNGSFLEVKKDKKLGHRKVMRVCVWWWCVRGGDYKLVHTAIEITLLCLLACTSNNMVNSQFTTKLSL